MLEPAHTDGGNLAKIRFIKLGNFSRDHLPFNWDPGTNNVSHSMTKISHDYCFQQNGDFVMLMAKGKVI